MKKFIQVFLLSLCFLLAGCQSSKNFFNSIFGSGKDVPNPTTETIVVESIDLSAKSARLKKSTGVITKEAKSPIVLAETGKIDAVADELIIDQERYEKLLKQIGSLEETVRQRDEAIVALQSKAHEDLNSVLVWGLRIGGILVVFGIIATIFGSKIPMLDGMGFMILSCGICTLVVCYTLMTKMMYLIPIGLVIVVGLIIFTVWRAIKHNVSKSEKDEVIHDLVKTVEYVKDHSWDPKKIAKLQKPKTQELVKYHKTHNINNSIA